MLLYKENKDSPNYDTLVFVRRDIENLVVPDNIRIIGKYAFNKCRNLTSIEFSDKSELKIIDDYAFHSSLIKEISIPSHVQKIGKYAF